MNDSDLALMQSAAAPDVPRDIVTAEARLRVAQLEAHASGLVRFVDHEPEELRARLIGDRVVITALRARLGVVVAGQLVRGVYRYTRIWAREGEGEWQVVGGHVSSVPVL